jgi:DinB superfamily
MAQTSASLISARITRAHEQVLRLTDDLPEAALRWQGGPRAPAIRFHLWHLARWADKVQASLPTLTPELGRRLASAEEIWAAHALATRWGLTPGRLGASDTGMGLDDEASAALPLPGRDELLAYARRVFATTDQRLTAIEAADLVAPCTDLYGNTNMVGDVLLSHLGHVNRHLGMIEALRGVQGMSGTATW